MPKCVSQDIVFKQWSALNVFLCMCVCVSYKQTEDKILYAFKSLIFVYYYFRSHLHLLSIFIFFFWLHNVQIAPGLILKIHTGYLSFYFGDSTNQIRLGADLSHKAATCSPVCLSVVQSSAPGIRFTRFLFFITLFSSSVTNVMIQCEQLFRKRKKGPAVITQS